MTVDPHQHMDYWEALAEHSRLIGALRKEHEDHMRRYHGDTGGTPPPTPGRVITYSQTDEVFANPYIGGMLQRQTHGSRTAADDVLDAGDYQHVRDHDLSLVHRVALLHRFADGSPISDGYLKNRADEIRAAIANGCSLVLKFCYTIWPNLDEQKRIIPPYGDPSIEVMEAHIEQLGEWWQANPDLWPGVTTFQSGFVGLWGENALTDIAKPVWQTPIGQWPVRERVIRKMLDAFPGHYIGLRHPGLRTIPLTDEEWNTRIGWFNDSFLRDWTDGGTYVGDVATERAFLANATRFGPSGGECTDLSDYNSPANVLGELRKFHTSYLNFFWRESVVDRWRASGVLDDMQRTIGYRLVLREAELPRIAHRGDTVMIRFLFENVGAAAPFAKFNSTLEIGDESIPLELNARTFEPGGTFERTEAIVIPDSVPDGTLPVRLRMQAVGTDTPEFAIRLANSGTWQDGANSLRHAIEVTT